MHAHTRLLLAIWGQQRTASQLTSNNPQLFGETSNNDQTSFILTAVPTRKFDYSYMRHQRVQGC